MGLQSDNIDTTAPFAWPGRSSFQAHIASMLDDVIRVNAAQFAAPSMNTKTQTRLHSYLESLRSTWHNPDKEPWIVNSFGAQPHGMLGRSTLSDQD